MLSGMNTDEMVPDNILTASTVEIGELGLEEEEMLERVVRSINSRMKVGCVPPSARHLPQHPIVQNAANAKRIARNRKPSTP